MEVKLGMYAYYHFRDDYMTAYCLKMPQAIFFKTTSSLLIARIEVKLGADMYYIVSMTTTITNSLREFSLKLILHSSNLLTVARMEVKLGTHAYYIISMTTKCFYDDHILFK